MGVNLNFSNEYQRLSFGDYGLRIISASETSTSGEHFAAIQSLEDSTISCSNNASGGDSSITSLVLASGLILYGNFDDMTVVSGKIICYLR